MTSPVHRSNNFDLIRLLAAIQVVLAHAIGHTGLREQLPAWQKQLFDLLVWLPGVPVFFVISGFLIARSYERNAADLKGYFKNRALRIFPALWVCLAVTLILLACFGFLPLSFLTSGTFTAWMLGQISFVQFFNPEQFRDFGIGVANGALWTITVELQFYLFLPLFFAILRKSIGKAFVITLFVISYIAFCFMNVKLNGPGGFTGAPFAFKLLHNTLLPHFWMFMVGIGIHRYFSILRPWLEGKFPIYLAAYLALAAVMQCWIEDASVPFYALLLPARVLLGFLTISAAYTAKSLSSTLLRGTDCSYGIYIYHSLVINLFVEMNWLGSLTAVPLIFGVTLILALLSWHIIEKPALSRKSNSPPVV
ncbi:MAG: acyltransferase [Luteolibacter sp.]